MFRSSLARLLKLHVSCHPWAQHAPPALCACAQWKQQQETGHAGARGSIALALASAAGVWALASEPKQALAEGSSKDTASDDVLSDGIVAAGPKLLSLSTRQRIYFKYEKRIRELSSLEKVFEYFSTHSKGNNKYMNGRDVVRSLVPIYPPYGSQVERGGLLDGERGSTVEVQDTVASIFNSIDTDGDGLISFAEYVVVVLLLSIPEGEVHTVFDVMDLDDSGMISMDEFVQVVTTLEKRAGIQSTYLGRTGSQTAGGQLSGLVANFFGRDGKQDLDLKAFRAFLSRLHEDVVRLEFAHYDTNNDGTIKSVDFANSLVAAADIHKVDHLLDKVKQMDEAAKQVPIKLQQFKEVARLRRQLPQLAFVLEFCGQVGVPVVKGDFNKLLKKTLALQLSPEVLDVLFFLFADEQGHLDGASLVDTLARRDRLPGKRLLTPGGSMGSEGNVFTLWWNCLRQCVALETDTGLPKVPL